MARVSKTTKKQVLNDKFIMPEIVIRDTDTKYTGGEPIFAVQPDPDRRSGVLVAAFNWYSRFVDKKTAKEQFVLYVENGIDERIEQATGKLMKRVDEREVLSSYAWLARLSMRGLDLTTEEKDRLKNEIERLAKSTAKPEVVEVAVDKAAPRTNVQEIMRERAHEAAGDLEGCFDDFILDGAKLAAMDVNPVSVLSKRNILPQHVGLITEVWKKKLGQYQEVLEGKDPQLNEAYGHYTKSQLKAVVKFIEAVIAGLDSYINVKKAAQAPRKRKAVSPEKQASKVKYLRKFDEFGLVSVQPSKIIGATEVWAYDTAKRKLHYYVADSHVGTLGIKGTTIVGFDAAKSGTKTLRKPPEFLKKFMSAGKPSARKLFGEINAVQAQPNGRTNENLILLKAY